MTRIYKNGDFYFFQDNDDLDRINTLNTEQTTYVVSNGRHYFKQLKRGHLRSIYSFLFADILNKQGVAYTDIETFNTAMARSADDFRSDQVIHRLVSAASTNDTLIRTGAIRLFGVILTNDAAGSLYVKYYNKATQPVVGTDIPVLTFCVKTKESINLDFGDDGILFDKGLGIGITGAIPDNDTTNTGANEMFAQSMVEASDYFYESLVGSIEGVASVTGDIGYRVAITGIINSIASVTGELIEKGNLNISITGVTTIVGTLSVRYPIVSIVQGISNVTGTLIAKVVGASVINPLATTTGTLTATGELAGESNVSITVEGILLGDGALIGEINAVGSTVSDLTEQLKLWGDPINGVAVVTGDLIATYTLMYVTVNGVATVVGFLSAKYPIISIIQGISTVTGTLVGSGGLESSINPSATVRGTLSIIGEITGIATTAGILTAKGELAGDPIDGIASLVGVLIATGKLIGESDGVGSTTSDLTAKGELVGESNGVGSTVSDLIDQP